MRPQWNWSFNKATALAASRKHFQQRKGEKCSALAPTVARAFIVRVPGSQSIHPKQVSAFVVLMAS
uniref:Uncharacterized protein n=1 Tax=Anguilla anguilla TaxID=7936 RepID=A0A0E9X6J4_ANGAN